MTDLARAMGFDPDTVGALRAQIERINDRHRTDARRQIGGCIYPPGWEQTDALEQIAEACRTGEA